MFESSFENSTWYFVLHITIVRSCLNGLWALVQYGGWFVPFRYFVFSPGVMARCRDEITPMKRRNNEKTPSEITKRRNNTRRNDEITKCATRNDEKRARKDENAMRNNVILNSYFSSFHLASFRYFVFVARRFFVIWFFRLALFRLFVISRGDLTLFRLFAWRYFVLAQRHNARRKDEKTKWHKPATIVKPQINVIA